MMMRIGGATVSAAKPASAGGALVPVAAVGSPARASDRSGGEIVRDGGTVFVEGVSYPAHGVRLPTAEVFLDAAVGSRADEPWPCKVDKPAWRDPATGFECIAMRANPGDFLGGYVGVFASRPLLGLDEDATPSDLGIEVHGGVAHAATCREGATSDHRVRHGSRRIRHVAVGAHRWGGWGAIVRASGGRRPTAHLLALLVTEPIGPSVRPLRRRAVVSSSRPGGTALPAPVAVKAVGR